jgi:hypothetical protein
MDACSLVAPSIPDTRMKTFWEGLLADYGELKDLAKNSKTVAMLAGVFLVAGAVGMTLGTLLFFGAMHQAARLTVLGEDHPVFIEQVKSQDFEGRSGTITTYSAKPFGTERWFTVGHLYSKGDRALLVRSPRLPYSALISDSPSFRYLRLVSALSNGQPENALFAVSLLALAGFLIAKCSAGVFKSLQSEWLTGRDELASHPIGLTLLTGYILLGSKLLLMLGIGLLILLIIAVAIKLAILWEASTIGAGVAYATAFALVGSRLIPTSVTYAAQFVDGRRYPQVREFLIGLFALLAVIETIRALINLIVEDPFAWATWLDFLKALREALIH